MLTADDAVARILKTVEPLAPERLPLGDVRGLALAEDVISAIDSPPFDKALMDGYAVRAEDVANGRAALTVLEQITAGQVPSKAITPGTAIQIMTGALLPAGADAVVRIEDTRVDGERVEIDTRPVTAGANILRRGAALRVGERVLSAGAVLTPSRMGALAELGCAKVSVRRRPTAAVLATGDELVHVEETPGPGQIRNSNEPMLVAQLSSYGANVVPLGIARDTVDDLSSKIREGLRWDVLVLSGGVSAGKLDLVPSTLAAAGVEEVFHKVDIKPGKPIWFGRCSGARPAYVFGLPGNPVSSLVCCELFVRTAVRQLMGLLPADPTPISARLVADHRHRSDRPTYYPAFLSWSEQGLGARIVRWQGSADLRATVDGNGMVLLPSGEREYQAGDEVAAWWWGGN